MENDDILEQFAVAYRKNSGALGEFLMIYPDHVSDILDYAHELNLVRENTGDRQLTASDEAWVDAEVARMAKARGNQVVLVCTKCSGRCTADVKTLERLGVAFCSCGQRAVLQDEAYFAKRNAKQKSELREAPHAV